jgi:hypothetical protein
MRETRRLAAWPRVQREFIRDPRSGTYTSSASRLMRPSPLPHRGRSERTSSGRTDRDRRSHRRRSLRDLARMPGTLLPRRSPVGKAMSRTQPATGSSRSPTRRRASSAPGGGASRTSRSGRRPRRQMRTHRRQCRPHRRPDRRTYQRVCSGRRSPDHEHGRRAAARIPSRSNEAKSSRRRRSPTPAPPMTARHSSTRPVAAQLPPRCCHRRTSTAQRTCSGGTPRPTTISTLRNGSLCALQPASSDAPPSLRRSPAPLRPQPCRPTARRGTHSPG